MVAHRRAPELTDGHEFDVLPVQELQRHRHVLQLHLAEGGSLVVLSEHLLLGQNLQQPDEPQAVAQVRLQVRDALVDAFQVFVAPPGERVLLDLLPRGVFGQILLRGGHLCVLIRGESVGSGCGALVEPGVGTAHFYGLVCLPVRWILFLGGVSPSLSFSLSLSEQTETKTRRDGIKEAGSNLCGWDFFLSSVSLQVVLKS